MIDNHYFIREISEEEAFSKEYGLTISYWKGITYNHNEKITIPADFIKNDTGGFVIKLIAFREPAMENGKCYVATTGDLEITYRAVDENTIKLNF